MIWLLLAALVCTILIQGFYSGIETGAYCVNRARLQVALDGKRRNAETVSSLLASMPILIATTLVGTNVAVYTSTAIVTAWFQRAGFHYAEIGATLALTPILFVFAEVTPKTLYARNADSLFYTMAPLLRASKIAFRPATLLLSLVIGFWKRDSLLRRLELLKQHAPSNVLLLVPQRLKGSDGALPELPGEVLFYKGVIPVKRVLDCVEGLAGEVA